MGQVTKVFVGFAVLVLLQSCYYLQPSSDPIRTLFYPHGEEERAEDLLVLLPGIGDYPEEFERNGFIEDLRASHLPLDVLAVNSHFGYYSDRTLLLRLKEDVVEPAFNQGYKRVHFAGISLGGYGALLYLRAYPDDLSSIILLAPYLGTQDHYRFLVASDEDAQAFPGEENIWPWLSALDEKTLARIYLGYGRADTYVESQHLLAMYLPASNSIVTGGKHRWTTWQSLWPRLLVRAQLPFAEEREVLAEL